MKHLTHLKYIRKRPLGNLKYGGNRSTQSSTGEPKFLEHPENLQEMDNQEETDNLEYHWITKISGALGEPRGNRI